MFRFKLEYIGSLILVYKGNGLSNLAVVSRRVLRLQISLRYTYSYAAWDMLQLSF